MIFCKRCGSYSADGLNACPKCAANLFEAGEPTLVGGTIKSSTSSFSSRSGGSSSTEPAGHGQRFLAQLIDSLLVGLIFGVGVGVSRVTQGGLVSILILLACTLVMLVYEPYYIATQGATPGKKAMGLRVVDRDGATIGTGKSIGRFVLKTILGGILWLVGLFTERRQCLHDLIVGTYVVRA